MQGIVSCGISGLQVAYKAQGMNSNNKMANQGSLAYCLLCGSSDLTVIDTIPANLVVDNYAKAFDVNVELFFQLNGRITLVECGSCGLRSYDPLVTGDAAFYEALQRLPWYYQDIKPEYHFVKTQLGTCDRLLEVGCGKGVFRSFLPDTVEYQGLEFNRAAIDKAKEQGLNVSAESIQRHADTHPGEYDVVCHFQVLEHVSDPHAFLTACSKAIKPGGKLIVAVPAEDSFLSICEGGWLNMPPHHITRWKDRTLWHALEKQLGMQIATIWHEPVAEYHQEWYRATLISYAMKKLWWRPTRLPADSGLIGRVARRLTAHKSIQDWLFARGQKKFVFAGRGHTVCIVGIKH